MKIKFHPIFSALSLAGIVISSTAGAVDLQIKGTLISALPCTINDGGELDIDFGKRVGIDKIDGVNYRHEIPYKVKCDETASSLPVTLTIYGEVVFFDDAAIKTNKGNMGIRVYQNGSPFKVGKSILINPKSPPMLEAVPVRAPAGLLTTGEFEAVATLRADYQ